MWRIMLCNPMKALLNQGCLNQWSFTARASRWPVIGWKHLCGLWPLSHFYRELISGCRSITDCKSSDTTWELRMGAISQESITYSRKKVWLWEVPAWTSKVISPWGGISPKLEPAPISWKLKQVDTVKKKRRQERVERENAKRAMQRAMQKLQLWRSRRWGACCSDFVMEVHDMPQIWPR